MSIIMLFETYTVIKAKYVRSNCSRHRVHFNVHFKLHDLHIPCFTRI